MASASCRLSVIKSVSLELGQGDLLGVKRARPAKLVCDLPDDVLQDAVLEQPDPQPRVATTDIGRTNPSTSNRRFYTDRRRCRKRLDGASQASPGRADQRVRPRRVTP